MSLMQTVTLLRSGNRLIVDSLEPRVREALEHELSYTSKRFLYGAERYQAGKKVEIVDYHCYSFDIRQRLATSLGFYDRIGKLLKGMGYAVRMRNLTPPEDPSIFQPIWDRLYDPRWNLKLRHGQEEFLVKLFGRAAAGLPARFDCPPAFGKSFLIGVAALLLPKAKFHVTTDRVSVLRDRIYPELCMILPDVGIVGGGKRLTGHRVMLYTFDSLHKSTFDADILIVDEVHEAAGDVVSANLARYDCSINFGLSATHDMRLDNKDMRVEAMFGPIVYSIPYEEAKDHGLVVPIEVYWTDVIMGVNPAEGIDDPVEKKRAAYWRNTVRNEIIAKNARKDQELGLQQLITCETVEHAFALKQLLPDFEVVYSEGGITPNDQRYFQRQGLWPEGHEPMTPERKQMLTKLFERGKLRQAIVTTVWNVGVSFNFLDMLNRADGGGSPIMDTQIPGRTSRINPEDAGKTVGKVRDYLDQFDQGCRQRAGRRKHNYESHGWKQHLPERFNDGRSPQMRLWTRNSEV